MLYGCVHVRFTATDAVRLKRAFLFIQKGIESTHIQMGGAPVSEVGYHFVTAMGTSLGQSPDNPVKYNSSEFRLSGGQRTAGCS